MRIALWVSSPVRNCANNDFLGCRVAPKASESETKNRHVQMRPINACWILKKLLMIATNKIGLSALSRYFFINIY